MLTQEYLKTRLHYNPETGLFTWLVAKRNIIGKIAGSYNADSYVRICIDDRMYLAQRLAFFYMTGEWPKNLIDHENRIRNDNSWNNLKEKTFSENNINKPISRRNKSGHTGIHFHQRSGLWIAKMMRNYKHIYIGYFKNLEDAVEAYKKAKEIYG